jgi:hypothetical protein
VSDRDAATAIGQRVEGVYQVWQASKQPNSSGRVGMLRLYCPADGSWACLVLMTEPPYPVEQAGPRRLFDEVEAAYRWWQQAGARCRGLARHRRAGRPGDHTQPT